MGDLLSYHMSMNYVINNRSGEIMISGLKSLEWHIVSSLPTDDVSQ